MPDTRVPVVSATAAVLVILTGAAALLHGWSEEAVRLVVRSTAKLSLLLFATAFSASSLRAFWRGEVTRQLMRHRRRIGLSFALSHGAHLAALVALALAFPSPFVEGLDPGTVAGGGLCYAFIFAMAVTSNDGAVRRLGARRWRRLHTVGGWVIWIVFALTYLPLALAHAGYWLFGALLLGVLGLRLARWQRQRMRTAERPGTAVGTAEVHRS